MKAKRDFPETVAVGEELSACPRCAYGAGFHVAFRREGRRYRVVLVCSACGHRFAVGDWVIPSGEPRPFDPSVDSGP